MILQLLLQDSRPVSEFEKLNYVGEGTFGVVCECNISI